MSPSKTLFTLLRAEGVPRRQLGPHCGQDNVFPLPIPPTREIKQELCNRPLSVTRHGAKNKGLLSLKKLPMKFSY